MSIETGKNDNFLADGRDPQTGVTHLKAIMKLAANVWPRVPLQHREVL